MALTDDQKKEIRGYIESEATTDVAKGAVARAVSHALDSYTATPVFAQRQEKSIKDAVDAAEKERQERLDRNLGRIAMLAGFGFVALLGFAYNGVVDSAKTAASEAATTAANLVLSQHKNAQAYQNAAIQSITTAQSAAAAAQTKAESTLNRTEAALGIVEKTLATIRISNETVALLQDVQENRQVIERILRDPKTLKIFTDELDKHVIPEGMVAAFPGSAAYSDECPPGWSIQTEAIGRMIVGAGDADQGLHPEKLSNRTPWSSALDSIGAATVGGAEEVTLSEAQMPSHSHPPAKGFNYTWVIEIPPRGNTKMNPMYEPDPAKQNGWFHHAAGMETGVKGAKEPHPNMPPYIALYFCKKD